MEETGGTNTKEQKGRKESLKRKSCCIKKKKRRLAGTEESGSGNTVLGNEQLETRVSSKPVSTECKAVQTDIEMTQFCGTDTPDNFDDEINSSMKDEHETKSKQLCQPEPCSEEEEEPKKKLKRKYLGTKVNLVLLGLAGTGKSASGNTILGKKLFVSRISSKPVTTECQEEETEIDGTPVSVIDTPDIFDDEINSTVKNRHVTKCKHLCQSDPCVYLLVMHVSRFTDGERDILTKLQKAFGHKVHEQTVVLFTRGDDLKRDDISLEEFLRFCQPDLKKVVEKCGNRCVLFENKASDSHQVDELMETVKKMLEEQQK